MAKKKQTEGAAENEGPELVESEVRPIAFVPSKDDITKAIQVGPQRVSMEGFEGSYHKKDEPDDAEPYALKIVADDQYGQTHHARNQDHSWSGTVEQFEAQFKEL